MCCCTSSPLAPEEVAMNGTTLRLTLGVAFGLVGTMCADEPKPKPVLEVSGYLVPVRQVQVSPTVAGRVVEVTFQEGQRVRKDEVLARLDDGAYRVERQKADAAVLVAQARLKLLQAGAPKD